MDCASKKLFTPGPLGCSLPVRKAMLQDMGSRDAEFLDTVTCIRHKLIKIAGVPPEEYTAVLLQGSGTFCVEAVLQTSTPPSVGRVLTIVNGAYGNRMKAICNVSGIPVDVFEFPEDAVVNISEVEKMLKSSRTVYTTVSVVHCETSSGIINPIEKLGVIIKHYQPNAAYFVDAMSSFGAIPINMEKGQIDYLVSSANKCLQGVPGFAFVIARKAKLIKSRGHCRSLSLDIVDQYDGFERNGQFRFTPPTHSLLAFMQALKEHQEEGGIYGRSKRYKENCCVLQEGMNQLGFKKLLPEGDGGYIITSYLYPLDPAFNFTDFYNGLNKLGQVIYPGKVTTANCFRIGNIGDLYPDDMKHLLKCVAEVLINMGVALPVS